MVADFAVIPCSPDWKKAEVHVQSERAGETQACPGCTPHSDAFSDHALCCSKLGFYAAFTSSEITSRALHIAAEKVVELDATGR
jgi:hypothetical protein